MGNQSCKIDDGEGEKAFWPWSECKVKSCDTGYGEEDNECVLLSGPCTLNPGVANAKSYVYDKSGTCVVKDCKDDFVLNRGLCTKPESGSGSGSGSGTVVPTVVPTGSCNGGTGSKLSEYVNGVCVITECDLGFRLTDGKCTVSTGSCNGGANTKFSQIENGVCVIQECNPGFKQLTRGTCTSIVGNVCNPSTDGGTVDNGAQTYEFDTNGICKVKYCKDKYVLGNDGTCSVRSGSCGTVGYPNASEVLYNSSGDCAITRCNDKYILTPGVPGTCTLRSGPCTLNPAVTGAASSIYNSSGDCVLQSCNPGYETIPVNGQCVSRAGKPCTFDTNAQTSIYDSTGLNCVVQTCKPGYTLNQTTGQCMFNRGPCTGSVANGSTYRYDSAGICKVETCATGWVASGDQCIAKTGICDTTAAGVTPVANSDKYTWTAGGCILDTCKPGYNKEGNSCVAQNRMTYLENQSCTPSGTPIPNAYYEGGPNGLICIVTKCADGYYLGFANGVQTCTAVGSVTLPTGQKFGEPDQTIANAMIPEVVVGDADCAVVASSGGRTGVRAWTKRNRQHPTGSASCVLYKMTTNPAPFSYTGINTGGGAVSACIDTSKPFPYCLDAATPACIQQFKDLVNTNLLVSSNFIPPPYTQLGFQRVARSPFKYTFNVSLQQGCGGSTGYGALNAIVSSTADYYNAGFPIILKITGGKNNYYEWNSSTTPGARNDAIDLAKMRTWVQGLDL